MLSPTTSHSTNLTQQKHSFSGSSPILRSSKNTHKAVPSYENYQALHTAKSSNHLAAFFTDSMEQESLFFTSCVENCALKSSGCDALQKNNLLLELLQLLSAEGTQAIPQIIRTLLNESMLLERAAALEISK